MKKVKPTSIELFAGAGGLSLGLAKAGFKHLYLVEKDKDACDTLLLNRPKWNVVQDDVKNFCKDKNLNKYKYNLDLLVAGYPCQSFSMAGKRDLNDTRGTLFYYFAKCLKKIKPKMFLVENVKGLISHNRGNTLRIMLSVFDSCGYIVQWKVLNSWDYQVAQKRERIFIVGIRNDLRNKIKFEFPKPRIKKRLNLEVINNKKYRNKPGLKYSISKKKILKLVPPGGNWKNLPKRIAKEYLKKAYYSSGGRTGYARRLSWNKPSPTLLCSPSQKQTELCHPSYTRPLNIKEYAKIQSFADDWIFVGNLYSIYRQIGNAVPVNLGLAIGKSLRKALSYD